MKQLANKVLLVGLSSMLIVIHSYSMEATKKRATLASENQGIAQCLNELPLELRRAIIFLALKEKLSKISYSIGLSESIDTINSVAYSPDGRTVLTGSTDNTARLRDISSGKQIHHFKGHTDFIISVAYSPGGKTVLTGSHDTTARLWDVETGKQLHILKEHRLSITSVAYSPDGKTVITGSQEGTARLWDVTTGKQLKILQGHTRSISSVAFSPNGKTVLTVSEDDTARLWDVSTGQHLHRLRGHELSITLVAYSPDGKTVLTGSDDTTARLWDTTTGECLHLLQHPGRVNLVTYSRDEKTIITGSCEKTATLEVPTAYLWNVATGNLLKELPVVDVLKSLLERPEGKSIIFKCEDGTMMISPNGKSFIITNYHHYNAEIWRRLECIEEAKKLYMKYYPIMGPIGSSSINESKSLDSETKRVEKETRILGFTDGVDLEDDSQKECCIQ